MPEITVDNGDDHVQTFVPKYPRASGPVSSSKIQSNLAAVDIETKDPYLKQFGSGAIRGLGRVLGVGVYYPAAKIARYFEPDDPLLRQLLEDPKLTLIMHNGVYDTDWLFNSLKFNIKRPIEDTMTREMLLDAYALSYSLDNCCVRRGVQGKNKGETIDEWWKSHGGKGKAIEHLDLIPPSVTGKYCVQDCKATYDLYVAQQPLLEAQNLLGVNALEAELYPFLMQMHSTGVRLDGDGRTKLSNQLNAELDELQLQLNLKYGFEVNVNAATDLEKIWRSEGLPIEYTATGKPSFASAVMENCQHPLAKQIRHMKALEKCLNAFVDGAFVDMRYKGRLWSTFYPARRDPGEGGGGTVTGRWSSQNINLQQIPAREEKWGKEIRSLFLPEEGQALGAFDYKQIEYRVFAHFAAASKAPGSEHIIQEFAKNPDLDYHEMGQRLMGWIDLGKEGRHLTKNFGFGSVYGLGPASFGQKFKQNILRVHPDADPDNMTPLAASLMNEYFEKVPFVKPTQQGIMKKAEKVGYVRTVSGRRQRLPPDGKTFKLVNYLCQGTAADILKKGVVDADKAGVWDVLSPHMVVHDEVVFSAPVNAEGREAVACLAECMRNAYKLTIPIGVDTEMGPDWGHCTEDGHQQYIKEAA